MAPVAVSPTTTDFVTTPHILHDVIAQAAEWYPLHELSFIASSAEDSIQTKTFSVFNQYGKPTGSIIVVYLTEHEDNMAAVWACLLAGYLPCLQPAPSAQQAHKEGHVAHIKKLFGSATWLTSELGAEQITSFFGLEVHLFSELKSSGEKFAVGADWVAYEAKPDDDAIMFLTSGSTGFSKAVVHTHRTILAACRAQGQNYGLTSDSKVLNWVGFDHVGGSLEFHITPLLHGASQLHVHASAIITGPLRLLRLIDEQSIQLAFGPNFLLSKLTRDLEKRSDLFGCFDLSSIKRINSGGEAIVSKTAQAFVAMMKKFSKNPSAVSLVIAQVMSQLMGLFSAGCIYNYPLDVLTTEPAREFLDLGRPLNGCEMRIVDPADGTTLRPDGESGELQIRGQMVFVRYYNNAEATSSSFVEGGWFRTGDVGIIENGVMRLGGRIKDTIIVHGIPELETNLQAVEGVMHSFLAAAPYRAPGQETEGFIIFYSPTFGFDGADASRALHHAPGPARYLWRRLLLEKLSRAHLMSLFKQGQLAKHIARSEKLLSEARGISFVVPSTETEKVFVKIYAGIFNLVESEVLVSDNFFEIGGTSLDAIRLKREGEEYFGLPDIPAIQILKHPVLSSLAHYVDSLLSKGTQTEEYDPIVPFSVTGNKTPIFFVHPGVGEVLIFVNLAKYFQNERPFYAFRARGFDSGHSFFTSMDEMVSCYAAAAKRIQATGPYAIAGYSYVEILLTRQQQLEFVWKLSPSKRIVELQLTIEKLDKWTDVAMSLINCGVDYIPTGSVSAVDVFYTILFAGSNVDWLDNQLKPWSGWSRGEAWSGFSRGEVSYILVPGEHTTLMDSEYVPQF
ncbi:atromentin synthetase [Suillus subalutaceus]|uniref:atromentin synthetase n=1 Tax=Suillus subalutaceus TaxID=48586 RepID=UPI001B86ECD7|nr:atromentin synthetase [Suillus subalutaceus]KAG1837118.1 atromentin synthetase [Suillus subalutaceus]